MKTFYKSHEIVVNSTSLDTIVFDVLYRGQYLLAGFEIANGNREIDVVNRMKTRVDQIIAESRNDPAYAASRRNPSEWNSTYRY
jgi:hypothetical protein